MLKAIKVINWACLLLGVVATAALFRSKPQLVSFANFGLFLPFALALVALRVDSKKVARWFALILNTFYFLLGLVVIFFLSRAYTSLFAGLAIVALVASYGANIGWFVLSIFRRPANPSLNVDAQKQRAS